jgi:site-specific DNA recombinase
MRRTTRSGPEGKPVRKLRCAVYTRKSTEEGLEQEFNSLHAQREACEAYVASQRSEGWALLREPYDDGGFSGGTLERPALRQLLADVEEGLVDVVVVYKIDRLSRSLMDFSKLVEIFDRNGVTFVSVTQSFNTTTSMGRLTLNILLSFAQFEREVTAERIRDKIRASRMKGMWMGGNVPLGYRVENRKLVVEESEAATVRSIFQRFLQVGSGTVLAKELRQEGVRGKTGRIFDKGAIYKLLDNPVYIGMAVHRGERFPGEHAAIIEPDLWDKVRAILAENARTRSARTRAQTPALLKGLIFGPTGAAMSPTHTRKGNRLYRYYVSQDVLKRGPDACPIGRVPAADIEAAVIDQLRGIFRQPEIIVGTWRTGRAGQDDLTEDDSREALTQLDPLWDELFPAEQARIVQLLVERVDVRIKGIEVKLRPMGLEALVREVVGSRRAAA